MKCYEREELCSCLWCLMKTFIGQCDPELNIINFFFIGKCYENTFLAFNANEM